MSLYKRGKTWHTDFSVNGQRSGKTRTRSTGAMFADLDKRTAVLLGG